MGIIEREVLQYYEIKIKKLRSFRMAFFSIAFSVSFSYNFEL